MLAREGHIRTETVQRLYPGAWAPRFRDTHTPCCLDCASADMMLAVKYTGCVTFLMARIAVGNDRQESYRLPGLQVMGLIRAGFMVASEKGDLEDQHRWLEKNNWFNLSVYGGPLLPDED